MKKLNIFFVPYLTQAEATLSYAEIKAVATGNLMLKEKMEVDNDVQRLKMLKVTYDSQHYAMQDDYMFRYPKLIAAEEKLDCVRRDVKERDRKLLSEPDFFIRIGGITYTDRTDGGTAFLSAASKCRIGTTAEVGEYKGFALSVEKNFMGANYAVLRGKTEYKAEISTSPVGCMTRLENLFNGIHEKIDFLKGRLEEYNRSMEQAKREYEKPFQYEEELKTKQARQFELNTLLDMENQTPTGERSPEQDGQVPHVAETPHRYGAEREENR